MMHLDPSHPRPSPSPRILSWFLPLVVGLSLMTMLVSTCGSRPEAEPEATTVGVVDSTFPIEEEIRRFVATVDSVPTTLRAGAQSRDDLVRRFIRAVETLDTLEFGRLVLQRDEFIGVYYPHTRFTAPPYELSPALLWFQMQNRSSQGLTRLLQRDGGRSLGYQGVHCPPEPQREAENRLWEGCRVEVSDSAGATRSRQLFGTILEHAGTFKFLTFANEY